MIKAFFAAHRLSMVGNAATALLALIAVGTLAFTIITNTNEQKQQAADDVRRQLLVFSHEVRSIDGMIEDPMYINLAYLGRHIGEELERQVRQSSDRSTDEGYSEFLMDEDNGPLILAIVGEAWEKNRSVQALLAAFNALEKSSQGLLGAYSVFGELGRFFAPHNHGISPSSFVFTLEEIAKRNFDVLPLQLPNLLGAVASAKVAKDVDFRKAMRDFIESAVWCTIGLSNQDLVDLTQEEPEPFDSHSEDARQLAEYIKRKAGDNERKVCIEMLESVLAIERVAEMENVDVNG